MSKKLLALVVFAAAILLLGVAVAAVPALHPDTYDLMATDAGLIETDRQHGTAIATLLTPLPSVTLSITPTSSQTATALPTQTPWIITPTQETGAPPPTATFVAGTNTFTPTRAVSMPTAQPQATLKTIVQAVNISGIGRNIRASCSLSGAIVGKMAANASLEVDTTTMSKADGYGWIRTTDGRCIAHERTSPYAIYLTWEP